MHTNLDHNTYTYLPNGKTHSIKWHDGAVWIYKYDRHGPPIEIESYNMQPTSRKPVQPSVELAIDRWQKCVQKNSVGACVSKCDPSKMYNSVTGFYRTECFDKCKAQQQTICGTKPVGPIT